MRWRIQHWLFHSDGRTHVWMKAFYPSQSVLLSQSPLSVLSHASFRGSSHPSRPRGHLSPNHTEKKGNCDFYQKGPSWPWKPSRLLLLRLMSWKQTDIIILLNVLQDARQVSKSKVTYLVSALFSFFPQDHTAQRSEPGCEAGRTRVTQKPTTALAQSALHTGLCSHPLLVFLFSDA